MISVGGVMQGDWRKVVQLVEELDEKGFVASKVPVDGLHGSNVSPLPEHHARRVARENVE